MGYSRDSRHVKAEVFNENGKWKYTVALDYSVQSYEDWNDWDLWTQAKRALEYATQVSKISGVTFAHLPEGWIMFVPKPRGRSRHPIMVKG